MTFLKTESARSASSPRELERRPARRVEHSSRIPFVPGAAARRSRSRWCRLLCRLGVHDWRRNGGVCRRYEAIDGLYEP